MTPSTFFIELTNKCNMNCKHCFAVSNNISLSKELLNKSIDFITNKINSSDKNEFTVNFLGGEAGLYNQEDIKNTILSIKNKTFGKHLKFIYQTNLTYELTEKHIEVFKLVDIVNTSYDYMIRFNSENQFNRWKLNIKTLQDNNCYVSLTMVMTKQFIEHYTPKSLIEFLNSININDIEFNPLHNTIEGDKLLNLRAKNIDVNNWQYNLYRYIKDNNIKMKVLNFDCLEDSLKDIHYNTYCRNCCQENMTILPNGNVITCMLDYNYPIYNLISEKEIYSVEEVSKMEKALPEICLNCSYLKYCKGDCHHHIIDETDCCVPKKIYEYLMIKKGIDNDFSI